MHKTQSHDHRQNSKNIYTSPRAHSLKYTSTNSLKIGIDIELFSGLLIIYTSH